MLTVLPFAVVARPLSMIAFQRSGQTLATFVPTAFALTKYFEASLKMAFAVVSEMPAALMVFFATLEM